MNRRDKGGPFSQSGIHLSFHAFKGFGDELVILDLSHASLWNCNVEPFVIFASTDQGIVNDHWLRAGGVDLARLGRREEVELYSLTALNVELWALFLDGSSNLFAVQNFHVSHNWGNDHLNVLAVLKHDSLAFAINDKGGVFAFDESISIVWLHILSLKAYNFLSVVFDVPSVVLEFLFRGSLDFLLCRGSSLGNNRLGLRDITSFCRVLFVGVLLDMLETSLTCKRFLLDFCEEVGRLLLYSFSWGSCSWVSILLLSLSNLAWEEVSNCCLSAPGLDCLFVALKVVNESLG